MYIAPSSDHSLLTLNLPFKGILRGFEVCLPLQLQKIDDSSCKSTNTISWLYCRLLTQNSPLYSKNTFCFYSVMISVTAWYLFIYYSRLPLLCFQFELFFTLPLKYTKYYTLNLFLYCYCVNFCNVMTWQFPTTKPFYCIFFYSFISISHFESLCAWHIVFDVLPCAWHNVVKPMECAMNAHSIGLTTLCHAQGSALTTICHAHNEW